MNHGVADGNDDTGNGGQLAPKPAEHLLEPGNEEHHEEDQDARGEHQQDERIEHRGYHLDFISFSRALKSAICASTRSRNPPASPASTMAV